MFAWHCGASVPKSLRRLARLADLLPPQGVQTENVTAWGLGYGMFLRSTGREAAFAVNE